MCKLTFAPLPCLQLLTQRLIRNACVSAHEWSLYVPNFSCLLSTVR